MRSALLLLRHSFKRVRALILSAAVLLVAFQVILILVAGSVQRSNSFSQMSALIPPFAREMLGPSLAGLMSFSGIVCLGYFHLVVMGSLVALCISLGTIPAAEVESGFIDLVLARPVARHWIITRAIVLVKLCSVALVCVMMAGTWIGLAAFAPAAAVWPTPKLIGSLAINLLFLMIFWSAISMAIGCASRRRGVAVAIAGILAAGTFLLDYVARLWKTAEPFGWLSPFRYYSTFELLMGARVPMKNLIVLAAAATVAFAVSYIVFARRDITR